MLTIEYNKDLSSLNTFSMKVSCACYVEYDSLEDLFKIDFDSLPQPVKHMGGGSNLLFTSDFNGTILHSGIKFIRLDAEHDDECLIEVGSGVTFDDFIDWACSMRLWGTENLSLIPGEVGASAVQNIGAYGVEVKDIIVRVNCLDRKIMELVTIEKADCHYGYRESFFKNEDKEGRFIITSVLFRLTREYSPRLDYGNLRSVLQDRTVYAPRDVRDAVIAIRNAKLPDPKQLGNAGSFFKNPVLTRGQFEALEAMNRSENGPDAVLPHYEVENGIKVPAAWMIERCGFKGLRLGGAAVYEKQPLVIVNASGEATPEEIIALERKIIDGVKAKFGVELHPEVEHL